MSITLIILFNEIIVSSRKSLNGYNPAHMYYLPHLKLFFVAVNLYELKTYHEVIDEIYYKVTHLEPWEKGSRKTAGQTGMCGGVSIQDCLKL